MFPIAESSTANDAKRLLFTSLAPLLYDYVGDPTLMQSLNHFLACYLSRIKPIELERDLEIDDVPCLENPEGSGSDTVLKCESMPLIPPFVNELGQFCCLPTTLETLQDYQNLVSYFMDYAAAEQDLLEADIFGCGEESHSLKFNYIEVETNSRLVSLKLFQLAQKRRSNLLKFPGCWLRIRIFLSYFLYKDYFLPELTIHIRRCGSQWSTGNWSSNHYSLLPHICLHEISEERLIYDWVEEYMNIVQENAVDRIAEYFNEIDIIMMPSRYQALDEFYADVFICDKSNFVESTEIGELTVWIDNQKWQEYQERYPLLKTIRLTCYHWLHEEDPEDDMTDEEEQESEGEEEEEQNQSLEIDEQGYLYGVSNRSQNESLRIDEQGYLFGVSNFVHEVSPSGVHD